jgi:hypothetical protein
MHQPRACLFPPQSKRNGRPSLEARGGRKSALKGSQPGDLAATVAAAEVATPAATERHGTPSEGGINSGVSAILAAGSP